MRHSSMVFRQTADGVLVAPPTCGLLAVPDLIGRVRAWRAASRNPELVIDLSDVEHVDGSAYRALVWVRHYCTAAGRRLGIVPPQPGVLSEQEDLLLQMLALWPGDAADADEMSADLVSA